MIRFVHFMLFVMMVFFINASEVNSSNFTRDKTICAEEFMNPPKWAKPQTWLHSMDGNRSKIGYTKDLEAIHDVGIKGVFLFTVSGYLPDGNIKFNSLEHYDIFRHVASECQRLGLQLGYHNCDGWTASGGPWIKPENSMKRVVSKSIIVDGGGKVEVQLPQIKGMQGFYKDIAIVAYPALDSQIEYFRNRPVVSSNMKDFNIEIATDGQVNNFTVLRGSKTKPAYIQFSYPTEYPLKRIFMLLNKSIKADGTAILSVSDDGKVFRDTLELEIKRLGKKEFGFDDQFDVINSKYFRITIFDTFDIGEVSLLPICGISDILERLSIFKKMDYALTPLKEVETKYIISSKDIKVFDINGNEDKFKINLPKGIWIISRYGFTSTGYTNSPASKEGKGLEVDKMNREALKIHYDSYVGRLIKEAKAIAPDAMKYVEIDSYEVGGQNWTDGYDTLFNKKYNYDIRKFLPLYNGLVVDSPQVAEDVLSDIRRLNSSLITENYFKYFTELCHRDGIKTYIEPYSINGPFCELDAAKYADVPMGEFWMHPYREIGTAVSGGHIYGKQIISSEAFSSQENVNWKGHPGLYKNIGDKAWTLGINEFTFHRFTHQPNTHVKPGMTMGPFGSHIDRTQTWWDNAGKAWMKYISRGQYILQKGIPVTDLLVFVGEGAPNEEIKRNTFGETIPNYMNFDAVNYDALCNRFKIDKKKLVLHEGTSYKFLALHNSEKISLRVMKKLKEISDAGIIIIGRKPQRLIGYNVSEMESLEFKRLVDIVWKRNTTYSTFNWDDIFQSIGYTPDLFIENGEELNYTHRSIGDSEVFFFFNPNSKKKTYNCKFRVVGKYPEMWNPMNGEVKRIYTFCQKNNTTDVPITLQGSESIFIVFKKDIMASDIIVEKMLRT